MSTVVDPTTIYPRYCFHLAPTFDNWCLLRICEVLQLEQHDGFQGKNFFFFRNLPMKWIRVVGVVVAVDDFGGRRVYVIDDGSKACIEALILVPKAPATLDGSDAVNSRSQTPNATELIDVGVVVDVKGELTIYRDEKQMRVVTIRRLRSSSQEQALREKRDRFRCEVLEKPWVLRNRDVRRCRKEAERSDADTVRKKRGYASTTRGTGAVTSTRARTKQIKQTQDDVVGTLKDLRSGAVVGKHPALGL